jgi:hypothetical protein
MLAGQVALVDGGELTHQQPPWLTECRAIVLAPAQRRQSAHSRSGTMAQLTYDEIRLLRDLKNSNRRVSGNQPHGGLDQLAKEGYVTSQHLNISEILYSITAKGLAALHDAEGND